ncbi:MAG: DUF5606 domain-containing protein [Chitinophagales bacterium]|jgi:hypothetical protein|nr:DUF5606 domain-containing protein [Sphingobacteriales bacterium]
MSFSEIVAVSKLPGLYQMHKHRADGLILKSLQDDKIFFAASRAHAFTPLDNITIYTTDEPIELLEVMHKMQDQKSKLELPSSKAEGEVLKKFFSSIIPNYDETRVYTSDIQKIVKWYSLLDSKNLIPAKEADSKGESVVEAKVENTSDMEEATEKKPKAKSTRKKKAE